MPQPGRSRKPMSEINVVPYIDVMLVLLIIFMVTAPLLTQGVKVDLPDAAAQAIDPADLQDRPPLVVSVDRRTGCAGVRQRRSRSPIWARGRGDGAAAKCRCSEGGLSDRPRDRARRALRRPCRA